MSEKTKCPYCNKKIEGLSKKHLENLLNQHILAKHKEKIIFRK